MLHTPFSSLEAMLSLQAMSAREGRTVTHVKVQSWLPDPSRAISGCQFFKVRTTSAAGVRRYIVKSTSYATDLIRRLSEDRECRERLLWEHGVLDRLPADVQSPTLAWAAHGDSWALLMDDVTTSMDSLVRRRGDRWNRMTWTQTRSIVHALAAIHAQFYRDPLLCDQSLALCPAYQLYAWTRPAHLEREGSKAAPFVNAQRAGWAMLERLDTPGAAETLAALRSDPTPLLKALARYPSTLVHGDPRRENMGLTDGVAPRLVLIDWQLAAALPPTVDLAWMLLGCQPFDSSCAQVIDAYRLALLGRLGDRFDDATWEPQLRLALLGQALRVMGYMLWAAHHSPDALDRERIRAQIPWWCEQVRAGAQYL